MTRTLLFIYVLLLFQTYRDARRNRGPLGNGCSDAGEVTNWCSWVLLKMLFFLYQFHQLFSPIISYTHSLSLHFQMSIFISEILIILFYKSLLKLKCCAYLCCYRQVSFAFFFPHNVWPLLIPWLFCPNPGFLTLGYQMSDSFFITFFASRTPSPLFPGTILVWSQPILVSSSWSEDKGCRNTLPGLRPAWFGVIFQPPVTLLLLHQG